MRHIYHILPGGAWDQSGPLLADSLKTEGFIHCSNRDQVEWVANQIFAGAADLAVLAIDVAKLGSPLRDEDPGIGQTFPHVYGPIEREAIVGVETLRRGADGRWVFPPRPEGWAVYRQDDNGNRFVVKHYLGQEEAYRLVAELEGRGHKQVYWAEPEPGR